MDLASLAATNIILITGLIVIVIILQRGFDILIKPVSYTHLRAHET